MFNWLGNLFPYSDLHSLNLDWILNKMKETAAQAAKAIADSANALAQVAEAKAAALTAQTAAQDAQTAANKAAGNAASAAANAVQALNAALTAKETATAANNKAQTAQETANTAQSAAETAQNTANTAQSAAQTAQNTANTAQTAAQTANDGVETLNAKFPIKSADIASQAITPGKLTTDMSKIFTTLAYPTNIRFPKSGNANINQITEGIVVDKGSGFRYASPSELLQFKMDIIENGSDTPNTLFSCIMSPVTYTARYQHSGLIAVSPFIVINIKIWCIYNVSFRINQYQTFNFLSPFTKRTICRKFRVPGATIVKLTSIIT